VINILECCVDEREKINNFYGPHWRKEAAEKKYK
jgi:hypothetical protein